ncbi:MAG: LysR family transcriptional regulator [Treponema sp.]|jgi:lysyl-tRNA synthetase class 2|nr:LysR family transcriptional regulator [Treponema sp.]
MDLELLHERARIIRRARSFFDERNYLELDTPLLAPDLIPESCLEVFETSRILPSGAAAHYWLIPSPEIWMKKIIAQHRTSVYQICKCFRNGESSGFLHSPEFTMLEYYTMDANYLDSLKITEDLFAFLSEVGSGEWGVGSGVAVRKHSELPIRSDCEQRSLLPFIQMTVAEAFDRFAGVDLFAAAETEGALETEARRLGLDPPAGMGTAQLYDLIFIHAVEPRLKQERPVALLDYPAFVPCLARKTAGGKTVERWELYYNGIELANCFTEETDAEQVRNFFESEATAKERHALVRHRVDRDYWKIFEGTPPLPPCSGVALGLDRLIMALCGRSSIDGVLPFPM